MEVYGEPGSPWVLAVAPAAASIPLGPLGTLALDPATLHVVGRGIVPSEGLVEVDVPIPATPALVGAKLHWQAATGLPPGFTNREPMVLTDS